MGRVVGPTRPDVMGADRLLAGSSLRRLSPSYRRTSTATPRCGEAVPAVDIIRRVVELVGPAQAEALRVFGHDLNAYRQWPVS